MQSDQQIRRNRNLRNKMNIKGLTTDCSSYVDPHAQSFIGMLRDITTFAKEYGLTERGVLRHIYAGDIPCVFISGIAFVLDLGPEAFARDLGWDLGPEHVEIIDKLLKEELSGKLPPKHQRRKKSGHLRAEYITSWMKNGMTGSNHMKIGY